MAERTQDLASVILSDYDGDAAQIWTDAESGADLRDRLLALPGIGPMKARSLIAILVKRFSVQPPGWEEVMPSHHTLGDVDSPEALAEYQEKKRAYKASLRAARAAQ
jgi:uncharacterized HhH-GPD family protein